LFSPPESNLTFQKVIFLTAIAFFRVPILKGVAASTRRFNLSPVYGCIKNADSLNLSGKALAVVAKLDCCWYNQSLHVFKKIPGHFCWPGIFRK